MTGSRRRPSRAAPLIAVVLGLGALVSGTPAGGQAAADLGRAEGFASKATGGAGGPEYVVRSLDDTGPGTLRDGAERSGPLRIRFEVSGDIYLATPLQVAADKTIDGRGAKPRLIGKGLVLERPNVILSRLGLGPFDAGQRQDAISLRNGARLIWIDHSTFHGAPDKAVEILDGATDITISWNLFTKQEQVIQAGAFETGEADRDIRLTVHHNFFDHTGYRNPRISYGRAHVYNNVLRGWQEHGMSARRDGQLLSENNVFEAEGDDSAIELSGGKDDKDEAPGLVRSQGDLLLNGADAKTREPERVFDPRSPSYPATVEVADQALVERVATGAGAGWIDLSVPAPRPSTTRPARPPTTLPGETAAPAEDDDSSSSILLLLVAGAVGGLVALGAVAGVRAARARRSRPGGGTPG